jgi:hypothetical protein
VALLAQLKRINDRKSCCPSDRGITDIISLNRTFFSYLAFYANYILGMSLAHFDLYLVLTRTVAIVILLITLWEIFRDRQNTSSALVFFFSLLLYLLATAAMLINQSRLVPLLPFAQQFVVIATLFLLQGYIHQIFVIRRTGRIGGLSKLMFQLLTIKEISMIAFAFSMGLENGWALVFMHASILLAELVLLWHFRWVRLTRERR